MLPLALVLGVGWQRAAAATRQVLAIGNGARPLRPPRQPAQRRPRERGRLSAPGFDVRRDVRRLALASLAKFETGVQAVQTSRVQGDTAVFDDAGGRAAV